jgi:hypothetical protein
VNAHTSILVASNNGIGERAEHNAPYAVFNFIDKRMRVYALHCRRRVHAYPTIVLFKVCQVFIVHYQSSYATVEICERFGLNTS